MSDDETPAVRIGHLERDEALSDLDAHREAGRLDGQEFEDRSVAVGRARTWEDIEAIFHDLPEPRPQRPVPSMGAPSRPLPQPAPVAGQPPADGQGWGPWGGSSSRLVPIALGLSPFVGLVLFLATGWWEWFLLVPVTGVIARGLAGDHAGRERGKGHTP